MKSLPVPAICTDPLCIHHSVIWLYKMCARGSVKKWDAVTCFMFGVPRKILLQESN